MQRCPTCDHDIDPAGFCQCPEKDFWHRLITELNEKFTLQFIAETIGVTVRQITNYKHGDRPKGVVAIRLVQFHKRSFCAEPV